MTDNTNPQATPAQVEAAMEALGCFEAADRQARYCVEHQVGWLSDVDACVRAEAIADAVVAAGDAPAVADAEERTARYAEAIRSVPGVPASAHFCGEFTDAHGNRVGYIGDGSIFEDYARAVMAVADAETEAATESLRAENERLWERGNLLRQTDRLRRRTKALEDRADAPYTSERALFERMTAALAAPEATEGAHGTKDGA